MLQILKMCEWMMEGEDLVWQVSHLDGTTHSTLQWWNINGTILKAVALVPILTAIIEEHAATCSRRSMLEYHF